jgi:DeoR family transcriptional regulator of aga operon
MCRDLERAEVMSEFVRQGEEVYFLSDSSKLGKKAVRTICSPGEMDYLISDDKVDESYRTFFREKGIRLITS